MRPTVRLILPFIPVLAFAFAPPADAQYFGRNAVQWDRLKFEVLKTEHFDVYYYPEEKLAAEQVGRMAERWYARLSAHAPPPAEGAPARHPVRQPRRTSSRRTPSAARPARARAASRRPSSGASCCRSAPRWPRPTTCSGHELVHAFQYDMTGQGKISDTNYPAALRMPLWFIEGMAEYLSVGPGRPAHRDVDARRRAPEKGLPTIRAARQPAKYFPYRYGQALWAYIAARYGDDVVARDAARHPARARTTPRTSSRASCTSTRRRSPRTGTPPSATPMRR